ncbi:MAG: hypothetical protein Kow0090_22780 [Myxococcota bacterium]
MPIYEYQCETCGTVFEKEQKITANGNVACPQCKTKKTKRLISNTNFALKGGGWYATEYGSHKTVALKEKAENPCETPASTSNSNPCAACPKSDAKGGS